MNIILAVTGSISSYKAYDIMRILLSCGHTVRVILTESSTNFVHPTLFKNLGANRVYTDQDDFNYPKLHDDTTGVLHIDLANWCDRFIIAPLTANSLAKIRMGAAEGLLLSTFLALDENTPKILYPAMNSKMLNNIFTQENFEAVKKLSTTLIHKPDSGLLACGAIGEGKLPTPETVAYSSLVFSNICNKKKVLITTGATISPIDPVRYLTNPSSGLTGFYLAKKYLEKGYEVTVIAGKNSTKMLDYFKEIPAFTLVKVTTTDDMYNEVSKEFPVHDIYISAAAINDIEFPESSDKIKKEELQESGALSFNITKDILAKMISIKKDGQLIVGFAAESDLSQNNLFQKMERKPVDLLVGTFVNSGHSKVSKQEGFANNYGNYTLVTKEKSEDFVSLSKESLTEEIFNRTCLCS